MQIRRKGYGGLYKLDSYLVVYTEGKYEVCEEPLEEIRKGEDGDQKCFGI